MPIKVYIDTNIFGHSEAAFRGADIPALEQIARTNRGEMSFVISDTVEREAGACKDDARRALLVFIARLFERVAVQAHQFLMRGSMGFLGMPHVGRSPRIAQEPLYADLRKYFDPTDAEHIFRAIRSDCDYFLTMDCTTILNRIDDANRAAIEQLCGKLRIVSPYQLAEQFRERSSPGDTSGAA